MYIHMSIVLLCVTFMQVKGEHEKDGNSGMILWHLLRRCASEQLKMIKRVIIKSLLKLRLVDSNGMWNVPRQLN